jgi:hypothetical protein
MRGLSLVVYVIYLLVSIFLIFIGVDRVVHAIDVHNNLEFIWGLVLMAIGMTGLARR